MTDPHSPFDPILTGKERVCLFRSNLAEWQRDAVKIPMGIILRCVSGQADINIDLTLIELREGMLLSLFPDEMVQLHHASKDFAVEGLAYSELFLREASLQIEHIVYSSIRSDRYRQSNHSVAMMFGRILSMLQTYTRDINGVHWADIAMMQLRSFFMAYYDYLQRYPVEIRLQGSRRVHELFGRFMQLVEQEYKRQHDVAFYAEQLHITPKYLCSITRTITHRTPKDLIDHQLVMQVKVRLSTSSAPIKQIVDEYGFSSASFFTRYFRTHTNMTPQEYRRIKN